jgi:hypothetical protein
MKVRGQLLSPAALHHDDVWRSGGIAPAFLSPALDEGERSASLPGRFTPEERAPDTCCIGVWVDLSRFDAVEKRKSLAPAGNRSPAVKPISSLYLLQLGERVKSVRGSPSGCWGRYPHIDALVNGFLRKELPGLQLELLHPCGPDVVVTPITRTSYVWTTVVHSFQIHIFILLQLLGLLQTFKYCCWFRGRVKSYFTTGGLPPISSSWRHALWDPRPVFFFNWTLAVIVLM